MATREKVAVNPPRKRPPATTPESRENQMIALAMDVVEERLRNGTASSQETTHFLKLGSIKEKRELALLEQELELKKAKTEAIQSAKRVEELYSKALKAMKSYTGAEEGDDE